MNFEPQIGMTTQDCFLNGIGDNEDICVPGTIEFVGKDYFIVRSEEGNIIIVKESSYYHLTNNFSI